MKATSDLSVSVKKGLYQAKNWLEFHVVYKKLNTGTGIALCILFALSIAIVSSLLGAALSAVLLLLPVVVVIIGLAMFNIQFALYFPILLAPLMITLPRYFLREIPLGIMVDVFSYIGLMGVLSDQLINRDRSWTFLKNPVTYMYLINLMYVGLEFFNPNIQSYIGYLSVNRRELTFLAVYIFISYEITKHPRFVRTFIIFWLCFALFSAMYGCFQEWFGLMDFELRWLYTDELSYGLIHVGGRFRIFSFFASPTSFGIFMAMSGLFAFIMMTGPFSFRAKILLMISGIIMFLGLAYSGTRTAYAMVVAGFVLFFLMNINQKSTLVVLTIFVVAFSAIIFGPFYQNSTINRIRSTFEGSNDPSMHVRDINRNFIQPYIYAHPIGGGIGTSGVTGEKFYPLHILAGFPPDSGLLKAAIEIGYIGIFLKVLFYFIVLQTGIRRFYYTKDKRLKVLYSGLTCSLFSAMVAQYAQDAIGMLPEALIMWTMIAIIANPALINTHHLKQTA